MNFILLESIQRKVTRAISGLRDFTYKQRLESLGLTTLLERRMRGDLIETFKILNNKNNYLQGMMQAATKH